VKQFVGFKGFLKLALIDADSLLKLYVLVSECDKYVERSTILCCYSVRWPRVRASPRRKEGERYSAKCKLCA